MHTSGVKDDRMMRRLLLKWCILSRMVSIKVFISMAMVATPAPWASCSLGYSIKNVN